MSERTAQSGAAGPVFEPVIFNCEDREIRAINDGFIVRLVAADIVEILGYSTVNHLVKAIDDDEKGIHTVSTLNGPRDFLTLSESGCYHAIFRSRKPGAQTFRRGITSIVIPETLRAGKQAGTPPDDTPSAGEPADNSEPREADQLSMQFERLFQEADRMSQIRHNLMGSISRRVQRQVVLLRQFCAVGGVTGVTTHGRKSKTFWELDDLMMLTQIQESAEMIQRLWRQETAFVDLDDELRELIAEVTIDIDRTVETTTEIKKRCEVALELSGPFDPPFPASKH